jgi:hypothetical protein
MPTYNFRNKTSGEVIDVTLRISELDEWKSQNPEWETIHLVAPKLVSGSGKDNLSRAGSGWNDLLNRVKGGSGRGNTIKTK